MQEKELEMRDSQQEERKDIFDKLMHLPVLNIFEPFYKKNKEALLYIFFGGITFFLNIILFKLIDEFTPLSELVNNIIGWIICVSFQYVTNSTWVFESKVKGFINLVKQIASFFGGRIFTLVVEEIILLIFITWLHFDAMVVKLAAQVIVIILNYVISKLVVFKK